MDTDKQQFFSNLLERLYNENNNKFDLYYKEGHGALIVPEGYPLDPRFVVAQLSELEIRLMMFQENI